MSILQSTVNYKSFDGTTSYIINDRTSLKSNFALSPHYYIKLDDAEGIYGADITDEAHPVPHYIGERSGAAFRRGKGITLSGSIYGRNISDMNAAVIFLREMFWDMNLRKLIWTSEGIQRYLICRVLNDLSVSENNSQTPPVWTWTVGLRANDPREYKVSDDTLVYSWQAV